MFEAIFSGRKKEKDQKREIINRLENVEKGQTTINELVAELVKADTKVLEAINNELDYIRPSLIAWVQAIIFLILSAGLVTYSAIGIVNESSANYTVTSIHQDAQSERVIAFQNALVTFANPSWKRSDLFPILKAATSRLKSANNEDATADAIENSLGGRQLFTQIELGIGSASLGAVLGWFFTQLLAGLRWSKKRKKKEKPRATEVN
ncbi:MAG TPA: hypothetical protein VGM53_31885 [Streptosporangiaceae bacterium]|jgi:hypothetical protein